MLHALQEFSIRTAPQVASSLIYHLYTALSHGGLNLGLKLGLAWPKLDITECSQFPTVFGNFDKIVCTHTHTHNGESCTQTPESCQFFLPYVQLAIVTKVRLYFILKGHV